MRSISANRDLYPIHNVQIVIFSFFTWGPLGHPWAKTLLGPLLLIIFRFYRYCYHYWYLLCKSLKFALFAVTVSLGSCDRDQGDQGGMKRKRKKCSNQDQAGELNFSFQSLVSLIQYLSLGVCLFFGIVHWISSLEPQTSVNLKLEKGKMVDQLFNFWSFYLCWSIVLQDTPLSSFYRQLLAIEKGVFCCSFQYPMTTYLKVVPYLLCESSKDQNGQVYMLISKEQWSFVKCNRRFKERQSRNFARRCAKWKNRKSPNFARI